MANPFLVLGGIAVGVITATFGILQVPGWVASAQDAAAFNDLANIRSAQAVSAADTGKYQTTLAGLMDGDGGVSFRLSGSVTEPTLAVQDDEWCSTVRSGSGAYFAAYSGSADIARASSPSQAAELAGCSPALRSGLTFAGVGATFTLTCPEDTTVELPIRGAHGTVTWDDDNTPIEVDGTPPLKNVIGGREYHVTVHGTFAALGGESGDPLDPTLRDRADRGAWCFTSMGEWAEDAGTTTAAYAFFDNANLVSVPDRIPSTVTDTSFMFMGASAFNDPAVSNWDVSNVTTMEGMFLMAMSFNRPLDRWDTAAVTNMDSMFQHTAFNRPIGNWDTGNVTTMASMFSGSPFNQDISSWDTSRVEHMNDMFMNTPFNQPIGGWNVSQVKRLDGMFWGAGSFDQPLNEWELTSATEVANMFLDATAFTQDLSDWNLSHVPYATAAHMGLSGQPAGKLPQGLG